MSKSRKFEVDRSRAFPLPYGRGFLNRDQSVEVELDLIALSILKRFDNEVNYGVAGLVDSGGVRSENGRSTV